MNKKPLFQKRHYKFFVERFREWRVDHNVMLLMVNEFAKDNPDFNPTKFMAALLQSPKSEPDQDQ